MASHWQVFEFCLQYCWLPVKWLLWYLPSPVDVCSSTFLPLCIKFLHSAPIASDNMVGYGLGRFYLIFSRFLAEPWHDVLNVIVFTNMTHHASYITYFPWLKSVLRLINEFVCHVFAVALGKCCLCRQSSSLDRQRIYNSLFVYY